MKKYLTKFLCFSIIVILSGCETMATTSSLKQDVKDQHPTLEKLQRKMQGKTVEYCVTRGGSSQCTYMSEREVRERLRRMGMR